MTSQPTTNGSSPPGHGLLGHLPAFLQDPLGFLTHCARSYGDVVPLRFPGHPAFLLLNPSDIERVLVTEHDHFMKPAWLRTLSVRLLLGGGLLTSEGRAWRHQRQVCQPAFHPRQMRDYGETISALTQHMLAGWEPGQTRDLQQDMTHLTLEIVARTVLGTQMTGWVGETGEAMDTLMTRFAARRNLFGMLPRLPALQELQAARRIDRTVERLIRQHDSATRAECTAKSGEADDLLARLRHSAEEEANPSQRQLREQVKTFLAAGYESSALALTWAFLLLAEHPACEEKLAAELNSVLGDRPPTYASLSSLPYTQAIVRETLRLYPPIWMMGRQARQRCQIGGVSIPAGALMMTSQWAMHRHPRYFASPDTFRPERWENTETAELPRYAYFPFGGGPRVCIGQSFALMELVVVLATIARRFRLEPLSGQRVQPWATMTLRPPTGVRVRLSAPETRAGQFPVSLHPRSGEKNAHRQ